MLHLRPESFSYLISQPSGSGLDSIFLIRASSSSFRLSRAAAEIFRKLSSFNCHPWKQRNSEKRNESENSAEQIRKEGEFKKKPTSIDRRAIMFSSLMKSCFRSLRKVIATSCPLRSSRVAVEDKMPIAVERAMTTTTTTKNANFE